MESKVKPPFYLRIWFFFVLAIVGFFGVLVTYASLLLWPLDIVLIILRIRWSIQTWHQKTDSETPAKDKDLTLANVPLSAPSTIDESYSPPANFQSSSTKADTHLPSAKVKTQNTLDLQNWHISISFGKSSSQNYLKAITLAKAAPQYHEQEDNGHILHQAVYSSAPKEFLAFIMLYELVGGWKSSFVIINGELGLV